MKTRLRSIWTAGLLLGVSLAAACQSETEGDYHSTLGDDRAVIYIVRHAEKQAGDDPALTPEGESRAARLAEYLSAESVMEVWSTDYARTRATAGPVASRHGLEVQLYEPEHNYRMADRMRDKDGVIVIVGHSNTIGDMASAFSGEEIGRDLDESDYETLYWVTIEQNGEAQVYESSFEGLRQRVLRR